MEKTRVAITGLGGIAQITHLPVLSKMDDVEIVAVCDVDRAKAKNVAVRYGIKNYFSQIDDLLANADAECLVVATPTNFHKKIAIEAVENGLHVLVEKPLARTLAEAQEMADAAKRQKRIVMVGMNNRFRPDIMMQESFISAKELGDIFYIKTGFLKKRSTVENWSVKKEESGGGVFMDLGIVLLDIVLWLLKFPKVKSVSAANYYHSFKSVEDSSFVLLRFENNITVTIETSWTLLRENDIFYCNVFGTQGSSSINPLRIYKMIRGTLVNITPLKIEKPANIFKRSYEYELRHFINAVKNSTEPVSNVREALDRMRIVDAVYKSAKRGKEVTLN
jgi:predicted dehydrogenase